MFKLKSSAHNNYRALNKSPTQRAKQLIQQTRRSKTQKQLLHPATKKIILQYSRCRKLFCTHSISTPSIITTNLYCRTRQLISRKNIYVIGVIHKNTKTHNYSNTKNKHNLIFKYIIQSYKLSLKFTTTNLSNISIRSNQNQVLISYYNNNYKTQ